MNTTKKPAKPNLRRIHAAELLDAAGITPTTAKINGLAAVDNAEERASLLESWRPA